MFASSLTAIKSDSRAPQGLQSSVTERPRSNGGLPVNNQQVKATMTESNLPATVIVGTAETAINDGKRVGVLIAGTWYEDITVIQHDDLSANQGYVWMIEVTSPKGTMLIKPDALQGVRISS